MVFLRGAMQTVKEYLFPVFCLSCEREGAWICDDCFAMIDITSQLFCPLCHEKTDSGEVCVSCTKKQLRIMLQVQYTKSLAILERAFIR